MKQHTTCTLYENVYNTGKMQMLYAISCVIIIPLPL